MQSRTVDEIIKRNLMVNNIPENVSMYSSSGTRLLLFLHWSTIA